MGRNGTLCVPNVFITFNEQNIALLQEKEKKHDLSNLTQVFLWSIVQLLLSRLTPTKDILRSRMRTLPYVWYEICDKMQVVYKELTRNWVNSKVAESQFYA